MNQTSVAKASVATLSTTEAERLRARLNHDLVKNRLILGLYGLGSMIRGEVVSPVSITAAIHGITEDWQLAKMDVFAFRDFLQQRQWCLEAMGLPFVRNLSPIEKKVIQEMLQHNPNIPNAFMLSENGDALSRAVAAVDAAISGLQSRGSIDSPAAIDLVELAITVVREFSDLLGDLRLSL